MRILIFHGYLLSGTGSNVYTAQLARALVRLGHEVHLLSQDRHPQSLDFVQAAGDWDGGALRVRRLRPGPVRCTAYRPDIGALLPVYVADRYEGLQTRTFAEATDEEIERYVAANVAAVEEVRALARPELALANHLIMGPAILARALGGEVPYAVTIHGSALEYAVKPQPERFLRVAREGLAGANCVLVGSAHTAESLWEAIGAPELPARTRLGPPGVDVELFRPYAPPEASARLRELIESLEAAAGEAGRREGTDTFARDPLAAAHALARVDPVRERLVAYVGKLIVSKGVDLLLAAWPIVLERVPDARLLIIGFGALREGLEGLLRSVAAGDLDGLRAFVRDAHALEGGAGPPLGHLQAFLESLEGPFGARYLAAAASLPERVIFTGRLEHEELARVLPCCRAVVMPSTFPEAFGMVAVEGAACGALPISAAHSGMAEVSSALAAAVPAQVAPWLSVPIDDAVVGALAERLIAWLTAGESLAGATREALVRTVAGRWSWEAAARGVIAAALGQLELLTAP